MQKNRFPILVIVIALVVASLLVLRAVQQTIYAQNSSPSAAETGGLPLDPQQAAALTGALNSSLDKAAGMGDLRRFEAQQIIPVTGAGEKSPVGMGDLRQFEALQANSVSQTSRTAGMGDLRRFEAQQIIPVTGAVGSSPSKSAGMGDLRRFEAEQAQTGSNGQ